MTEVDKQERTPKQRPYHHGDLRNALIEAGLEVLLANGAAALNLREVARRAGVSHAAPYRHFADKQALIAAIARDGFVTLLERINGAIDTSADDPRVQLLAVGHAYVRFAVERPGHLRVMFGMSNAEREADAALAATAKLSFAPLVGIIKRGQDAGVVRPGDPVQLALVTWSAMHGLALLIVDNQIRDLEPGADNVDHLVGLAIGTLYQGLRSDQGSAKVEDTAMDDRLPAPQ